VDVNRQPGRRPRITFLILVLLAVALVSILRPAGSPYLDLLRQGDEHAARTERTAAVAAYGGAVRLRPGDPGPHLRLARVYLDWGRTKDALAALSEAGRLGAEEAVWERLSVAVHAARADWPAVVEHAQQLLGIVPADGPARHTLARAYVELGEWDAARAEYETLSPDDAGVWRPGCKCQRMAAQGQLTGAYNEVRCSRASRWNGRGCSTC